MNSDILPVESIQERDLDMFLLEEFNCNDAFCEWFIQKLGLPKLHSINGAQKSILDFGLGETDILFSYNSPKGEIYILIENKIDAPFTDKQYERYKKRALEYENKGMCVKANCLLVAPLIYCKNQNSFQSFISYEDIAKKLSFIGTKRSLFKSNLLEIAIEKRRRGYQSVNSLPVQKFWLSYWEYKEDHYPELIMEKPTIVPHGSDSPLMKEKNLERIEFLHKLGHGNADMTFCNHSDLEEQIRDQVPEHAKYEKHDKLFSIRISVPKIDRFKDFNEQINFIEIGLKHLDYLRKWALESGINKFKSNVLKIAVEKPRKVYSPPNVTPAENAPTVQKFWLSYWKYKQAHYPELIMKKKTEAVGDGDWSMMKVKSLKGIQFSHKLEQGNADMTFCNHSDFEEQIRDQVPKPKHAKYVKYSKRFAIKIPVPKVDRLKDFDEQIKSVEIGLKQLDYLRKWALESGINKLKNG